MLISTLARKNDTTAGCVVGLNISYDKSSLLHSRSQSFSGGDGSGSARAITGDCCQSEISCVIVIMMIMILQERLRLDRCQSKIITGNQIVAKAGWHKVREPGNWVPR